MTAQPTPLPGTRQLLDGGVGSELKRRGVALSNECWSAESNLLHQSVLTDIHLDYIRTGADVITANTFAATRFVLASAGLEARFEEISRLAVGLARRAADSAKRPVLVAGSLSCLPPKFDTSTYPKAEDELRDYLAVCDCFVRFGADLILLEMMQDTEHAVLACRAAQSSKLPFWIGISCAWDSRNGRLVAFDNPEQPLDTIIEALAPFNPAGISIMHSPPDAIAPAIELLTQYWAGPIGAYAEIPYSANSACAGNRCIENGAVTAEQYAAFAAKWLDLGAEMIGGCCGTTPAHIEALRRLIDS